MVEAVRTPIAAGEPVPARRSLDERVFVRAPRLYALASRAVMFLPPRSRIRRALAGRGIRRGWAAWARLDLAVT